MKRLLLSVCLCLLLTGQAFAWMGAVGVGQGVGAAAATNYCDTQSGYLFCEDFDSLTSCESGSSDSNCRNTWAISTTCSAPIDYSYTSSQLAGINSAYLDESDGSFSCSVVGTLSEVQTTVYAYARVKIGSITLANDGDGQYIFGLKNASGNLCLASAYKNSGNIVWGVYVNTTHTASAVPIIVGKEYHLWIDCTKNVANGAVLYVSETATKPSASVISSNSTQNYDITQVVMNVYDSSGNDVDQIVIDNILVDDAEIGDQ